MFVQQGSYGFEAAYLPEEGSETRWPRGFTIILYSLRFLQIILSLR